MREQNSIELRGESCKLNCLSGTTTTISIKETRRPWILQSRLRLLLTLFLLLSIPAAIFTVLLTLHVRKQITEQTLQQHAVLTKMMARTVGTEFYRLKKEVEDFAFRARLIEFTSKTNAADLPSKLNELVRVSPAFSRAFVTDPNGNLLGDYPLSPKIVGMNFSDRDWFKGAKSKNEAYVSEVYHRTNLDNALVVTICTRIRNAKQKTVGYLGAQFTAAKISKWLEALRSGEESAVFVLDQHGNPALVSAKWEKLARDPALRQLKAASGSLVLNDDAGRKLLFNYERVTSNGWIVFAQVPSEAIASTVRPLLQTTAIFFVLSLVMMIVIGLYWFRTISDFEQERERVDRQLRSHAINLKRSNQELEALCYSIAHDLRAPLRAMRGFALALREECGESMSETGRDYTMRIGEGAERMDELTDALLSYGRLGHTEMPLGPVSLDNIIRKASSTFAAEIQSTSGCIDIKKPLLVVLGNEFALQQTVENLLSNALKFVKPGSSPSIKIWAEEKDGKVFLKIQDNGIGIDSVHHQRIFGVFERLHSRDTYPGTGIGLAIVRKSIERLGGQFGLESQVGEGSCFWFSLPKGN